MFNSGILEGYPSLPFSSRIAHQQFFPLLAMEIWVMDGYGMVWVYRDGVIYYAGESDIPWARNIRLFGVTYSM